MKMKRKIKRDTQSDREYLSAPSVDLSKPGKETSCLLSHSMSSNLL